MSFHRNLIGDDLHEPSKFQAVNNTGSVITSLKVVKTNNYNVPLIQIVPITSVSDRPVGLVKANISSGGGIGVVVNVGILDAVDTSSFGAGIDVFADANGDLTAADTGLFIGTVLVSDVTNGIIFLNVAAQGSAGVPGAAATAGVVLVTPIVATAQASIGAALAAAVAGDAVVVGPGIYAESVTIPAGVSLIGAYGFEATTISGALVTGTRITINDDVLFQGFTIILPTDNVPAVNYIGATTAHARFLHTVGSGGLGIGIRCSSGDLTLVDVFHNDDCDIVFDGFGGVFTLVTSSIQSGSINTGIRVRDGSVVAISAGLIAFTVNAVDGFTVDGGILVGNGYNVRSAVNALHVTSNLSDVQVRSVGLNGSANDILVDPLLVSGTLHVVAGELQTGKINAPFTWRQNADFLLSFQDDENLQKPGFRVVGDIAVGTPAVGTNSSFGQGDPTVDGMVVLQNTNLDIGAFVDITSTVSVPAGTVQLFINTAVNNTVFFGGDTPFFGVFTDITVAINLGGGSILWEFWNGAIWQPVNMMARDAQQPLQQYANDTFGRVSFEHNHTGDVSGWTTLTLNGSLKYWLRVRIIANITASPVIRESLLETSRTEVARDGTTTFVGEARFAGELPWFRELLIDSTGESPTNQNVLVSANISLAAQDNVYNNGTVKSRGGVLFIGSGLDSSFPLILTLFWYPLSAGGGFVEWELDFARIQQGDVLDGTLPDNHLSVITPAPATILELTETSFEIDVSNVTPDDLIAIRILRDASGSNPDDTLNSNAILLETRLFGTFWKV